MQYQSANNYRTITNIGIGIGIGIGEAEIARTIERMCSESAVVIFSVSTCCMCHAIKRLLCEMGVNPTVHELDLIPAGHLIHSSLLRFAGAGAGAGGTSSASPSLPLVFVGGKLVGAMDTVMASHINGTLVPLLKEAGALWL